MHLLPGHAMVMAYGQNIRFCVRKGERAMTGTTVAKELGIRRLRSRRAVRLGGAASGFAVVLMCGVASPALAQPNESRQVHVEGQLIPVNESPSVYRVSGGLLGTYRLRTERIVNAWTYSNIQIREIQGTAAISGCVDLNLNKSCDPGEPSGDLRLTFSRVASFDTEAGRLIEGRSTHQLIGIGPFSSGRLATRDIPVGSSAEIVSTYQGDLEVMEAGVDSKQVSSLGE
jgi:hypothetical protein